MSKLIFAAAAVLVGLASRAYYVGFFNDDAFYIIGARSLLGIFRYAQLNAPGAPALIQYFPGYPILLAPIAAVAGNTLWILQAYSALLALAGYWACHKVWASEMKPGVAAWALAACLFNPLALSLGAQLHSEIGFLLCVSLALLWIEREPKKFLPAALLAGFAGISRAQGVALPAALGLVLLLERRWRDALLAWAVGLAPVALFFARNRLVTGQASGHVDEIMDAQGGGGLAVVARNIPYYLEEFSRAAFRAPGGALLAAAALAACAVGLYRLRRERWARVLSFFLLGYGVIVLVWSKQAGRYLYPVLPFILFGMVAGLGRYGRYAAALSLLLAIPPDFKILRASLFEKSPLTTPPRDAFGWLKANCAGSLSAAELDGRAHLLTGCPFVRIPNAAQAAELIPRLKAQGIRYVLSLPTGHIMRTRSGASANDPIPSEKLDALLRDAGLTPVFRSEAEGSSIYDLGPASAGF